MNSKLGETKSLSCSRMAAFSAVQSDRRMAGVGPKALEPLLIQNDPTDQLAASGTGVLGFRSSMRNRALGLIHFRPLPRHNPVRDSRCADGVRSTRGEERQIRLHRISEDGCPHEVKSVRSVSLTLFNIQGMNPNEAQK